MNKGKYLKKQIKKEKAITLIALIVTIIVLIILAGISINMLTGNNGILTKVEEAKEKLAKEEEKEKNDLEAMYKKLIAESGGSISNIDVDLIREIIQDEIQDYIAEYGSGSNNGLTMNQVIDKIYPVGSIYISADAHGATNPGQEGGIFADTNTTWVAYGKGRTLVGATDLNTPVDGYTFVVGQEMSNDLTATNNPKGEYKHRLLESEVPSHTHTRGTMAITGSINIRRGVSNAIIDLCTGAFEATNGTRATSTAFTQSSVASYNEQLINLKANNDTVWTGETSSFGGSGEHNNIQPYTVVYMWQRTN